MRAPGRANGASLLKGVGGAVVLIFRMSDGGKASMSMDLRSNSSIDLFSPGVAVDFRILIFLQILSKYIVLSIGFSFVDWRCWQV